MLADAQRYQAKAPGLFGFFLEKTEQQLYVLLLVSPKPCTFHKQDNFTVSSQILKLDEITVHLLLISN